jgi:hypothetical protein
LTQPAHLPPALIELETVANALEKLQRDHCARADRSPHDLLVKRNTQLVDAA